MLFLPSYLNRSQSNLLKLIHIPCLLPQNTSLVWILVASLSLFLCYASSKKGKKTNFLLCAELCCFMTGKSSFLRTFTVVSCVYWANVWFLISKVLHKFSFLIYFKICKHLLPRNINSFESVHQHLHIYRVMPYFPWTYSSII